MTVSEREALDLIDDPETERLHHLEGAQDEGGFANWTLALYRLPNNMYAVESATQHHGDIEAFSCTQAAAAYFGEIRRAWAETTYDDALRVRAELPDEDDERYYLREMREFERRIDDVATLTAIARTTVVALLDSGATSTDLTAYLDDEDVRSQWDLLLALTTGAEA